MIDALLLSTVRVATFQGPQPLTAASGFLFERDTRLFVVTSRHVLSDPPSGHEPDRIEITLHTSETRLAQVAVQSLLLYDGGRAVWRQGRDASGAIDVAVIELQRHALPPGVVLRPFTPAHLLGSLEGVEVGQPLLLVGYPLGFYDTVHHLPVVRQAAVASAFGVRFQGQGLFLTDARAHRGSSGGAVVMRDPRVAGALGWRLLGVHSSRMDMATRDRVQDESLGLNCAWYADILLTLTEDAALTPPGAGARPT
ncbi:S1 family peptidase [Ramlibacter tataouinensis]|uniref:S1 family peptidase n=1 Tax=Ramlibacter tataouinensis TaxID=94132 RepID=UPI0006769CEC|nr:serine protease [Ramlibacter tataouinensis]